MRKWVWVAVVAAAIVTGYATGYVVRTPPARDGMGVAGLTVPLVTGYAEGEEILFIHTEASDPKIADVLTRMMDSPVLLVPSLADAPESMLATVYVFTNGVTGGGPLGFQPDVFDEPPGSPGYRPLRAVHLVTWKDEPAARVLSAAADVTAAERAGEVTIGRSGVVVNMPFLTWPRGRR